MIMSLIIMKIIFICFYKDDISRSRIKSNARSYDYKSCDHGITLL